MLQLSTVDSATDPASAELLIPDEIHTSSPMSNPPLQLINDPYPIIVLLELEAKLTAPSIPSVY